MKLRSYHEVIVKSGLEGLKDVVELRKEYIIINNYTKIEINFQMLSWPREDKVFLSSLSIP